MPNWCYNEMEVTGSKENLVKFMDFIKGDKRDFDFNKVLPYPEEYEKLDLETPDQFVGYNNGGYNWCIKNWGTKWNACEPNITLTDVSPKSSIVEISFDSAWSPSEPITRKLSELFPDLTFKHSYEEGGCDFSGCLVCKNGKILEDKTGLYDDFPISEHYYEEDEED